MLIIMVIVFSLCWLPAHLMHFFIFFDDTSKLFDYARSFLVRLVTVLGVLEFEYVGDELESVRGLAEHQAFSLLGLLDVCLVLKILLLINSFQVFVP